MGMKLREARKADETVLSNQLKYLLTTLPITTTRQPFVSHLHRRRGHFPNHILQIHKYLIDIVARAVDCIKLVQMMKSGHFSKGKKGKNFASSFLILLQPRALKRHNCCRHVRLASPQQFDHCDDAYSL